MLAAEETRRSAPTLREVVGRLAPIVRAPGSQGEAESAAWLAERLEAAGARDVRVERTEYRPGYAPMIGVVSGLAAAAGLAALRREGARPLAAAAGLLAAGLIADDVSNGPRVLRRLFTRPKPTQNVVASAGDPDGERTLLVLAHHDAAPTGLAFDQSLQHALADRFPGFIARTDTAPSLWRLVISGPLLIGLGAVTGRRLGLRLGTGLSLVAAASFADIARGRTVPGANDNLSGCAVLVAAAERLADEPVEGLRVVLASCGAEEVCQGGIYGFFDAHREELPRASTWVLNLDSIGSPQLVMLEGEGPIVMEDYPDPSFRDLVADVADEAGVSLRRGQRATSSTDSVLFARAGYPTTTLVSFDYAKALSNYHQMSDTAENLDYDTVADGLEVTLAVARRLAGA